MDAVGRVIRRGLRDWRSAPERARRSWLSTSAVGLLVGVLAVGLASHALRSAGSVQAWDEWLLRRYLQRSPLDLHEAIWAGLFGNSLVLIGIVLAGALFALHRRLPFHALAVLASLFMMDLLVLAGWLTWPRGRPDLVLEGAAAPDLHSFPSGHVAQTISVYGLGCYLWLRSTERLDERVFGVSLVILLTGVVAAGRLRVGAHWPSDVLAGGVIGCGWLLVTIAALRRAEAGMR